MADEARWWLEDYDPEADDPPDGVVCHDLDADPPDLEPAG